MSEETLSTFFLKAPPRAKLQVVAALFFALITIGLAVGAIAWIFKARHEGELQTQARAKAIEAAKPPPPEFTFPYEVKDMALALMDRAGTRTAYAQFTLVLDCPDAAAKAVMEEQHAKILDSIFEVGSNYYTEDFTPPLAEKGFKQFKEDLRHALVKAFKSQAPRRIVLKDWYMN